MLHRAELAALEKVECNASLAPPTEFLPLSFVHPFASFDLHLHERTPAPVAHNFKRTGAFREDVKDEESRLYVS